MDLHETKSTIKKRMLAVQSLSDDLLKTLPTKWWNQNQIPKATAEAYIVGLLLGNKYDDDHLGVVETCDTSWYKEVLCLVFKALGPIWKGQKSPNSTHPIPVYRIGFEEGEGDQYMLDVDAGISHLLFKYDPRMVMRGLFDMHGEVYNKNGNTTIRMVLKRRDDVDDIRRFLLQRYLITGKQSELSNGDWSLILLSAYYPKFMDEIGLWRHDKLGNLIDLENLFSHTEGVLEQLSMEVTLAKGIMTTFDKITKRGGLVRNKDG